MKKVVVWLITGCLAWGVSFIAPAGADPLPVVRQAQENLSNLGYYKLRHDGVFGPKTQLAVLQYQYEMDLPITGILDDTTLEHLKRPCMILNTQDFAPFHYKTRRKGEADGPIPQIVRIVCSEAGINCRIILHDEWRHAQEEVKSGDADGLFVIAWNSKRAQWLHRSTAIIETEYGLFVRNDDDIQFDQVFQQPSVLEEYRIGVYGPSGTSNSLKKLQVAIQGRGVQVQTDMQTDDKPLFRKLALSKGKFAVYSNKIVGESIIRGLGLSNTRYAGQHRELSYYVGFSKERVPLSLVKKFNKAYRRLVDRGDVIAIMANHSISIPKKIKAIIGSGDGKEKAERRFSLHGANGVGVVVDATTCLMWQRTGSFKHFNWIESVAYIERLNKKNYAGFSDWRMPTIDELSSLMEKEPQKNNHMHIHSIFDSFQQSCWSKDKINLDVQFVDYLDGAMGTKSQGDTNFVRAVRGTRCNEL